MLSPIWKSDRSGLYCTLQQKTLSFSHTPDEGNRLLAIMATPPETARRPDIIDITFDISPGFDQFGAGIMLTDGTSYIRFFLIRDRDTVICEETVFTNDRNSVVKSIRTVSETPFQPKENRLTWQRRTGRYILNGRLLLQTDPCLIGIGSKIALFGINQAIVYRRLRFKTSGTSIDAGSKRLTADTVSILDEMFNERTRITQVRMFHNIQEDGHGRLNILGP
jgi:hypothetical protein